MEEKSPVRVEVYSSADEVGLFLNGVCIGRKNAGKENHYKAEFVVDYEHGLLEAVGYTDGREVSRDSLRTAGEAARLRITPDRTALHQEELKADGQSLCFAVVEVVDSDGNLVPYAEKQAEASVEGAAVLAAFGTGRTITEENYTVGKTVSYQGKLLAVIRAGYEEGDAKLTVKMEGLPKASLDLKIV